MDSIGPLQFDVSVVSKTSGTEMLALWTGGHSFDFDVILIACFFS